MIVIKKSQNASADPDTTDTHPSAYDISSDNFVWYLYSQNEYLAGKLFGMLYGPTLSLKAFSYDELGSNWIKTLWKISNLIGRHHFSAFYYAVYKV